MSSKQAPSGDEFVTAAIAFVDERGLAALTLRSLGEALGVNHTALYRHFRDKDDLLLAMIDTVIADITNTPVPARATPRNRLLHLLRQVRIEFSRHPELTAAIITTSGTLPHGHRFTTMVVDELVAMGVPDSEVAQCYQLLEDFVMGATIYDLGGAPDPLETRRVRHRLLGHPLFDDLSRTTADIVAHNEAAFELGLGMLLDGCAAIATSATRSTRR